MSAAKGPLKLCRYLRCVMNVPPDLLMILLMRKATRWRAVNLCEVSASSRSTNAAAIRSSQRSIFVIPLLEYMKHRTKWFKPSKDSTQIKHSPKYCKPLLSIPFVFPVPPFAKRSLFHLWDTIPKRCGTFEEVKSRNPEMRCMTTSFESCKLRNRTFCSFTAPTKLGLCPIDIYVIVSQ